MEKYSVLMSLYKREKPEYLIDAIDSMISQTVKPDEIVIVKDGPLTPELEGVLNEYTDKYPDLFNIVESKENIGLGRALNLGLENCKNELIARMDTDDISLPERCEKELLLFENDADLDIVGCPVKEFIDTPDNIVGVRNVPTDNKSIHDYAKRRDPFNHPAVMFRKSKVLTYGPYRDYRKNQDTALWIDMLSNGCKAANCSEYLLMFRFDEGTYKKRKSWLNTKLLLRIRRDAYRKGFSSLGDFLAVSIVQTAMFLMPIKLQRWIYRSFLRK